MLLLIQRCLRTIYKKNLAMIKSFLASLRIPKTTQIIDQKKIMLMLLILSVVLALLAGYYHASLETQTKKYQRLEDMYVRVRGQLGREETQRLIDLSRANEQPNTGDTYGK